MKTQSVVSDVTVQVSSEPVLTLPRQLSRELGLRSGQRVSVRVRNGALKIRKNGKRATRSRPQNGAPKRKRQNSNLMDWAGSIKSKTGRVIHIEDYMKHHGYEQFEGKERSGF
ncbi:MAG: AbrB/MazE/SpoVT family DNA-binding domain-containing protein [Chloroflexi bacterium]|nr:AbrB/MazE/SpoVT family DNA-binding domain-containing protein [Chloroflexota bacterium]